MNLNEIIMESIKGTISGKKNPTSVQFGGSTEPGIKDQNMNSKNQADLEAGLKSDGAAKENKNPQGEAKSGLTPAQMATKLGPAVIAGIACAGAKKGSSAAPKFTPPAPATK